jgi:hypothetical protein
MILRRPLNVVSDAYVYVSTDAFVIQFSGKWYWIYKSPFFCHFSCHFGTQECSGYLHRCSLLFIC